MRESTENQMCPSSLCFFRNCLLYVAILVLFLAFTAFSSSIFSSVLLISFTVLISSSVFLFKLTNRKPSFEENLVKDELKNSPEVEEVFPEPELENESIMKVTQVGVDQIHDYLLAKSSSSETESGDISFSSEDSDADWSFRNDVGQFPMFSDDSISDDDSLIEIELPGGHYIGSKEEPNFVIEPKDHYKIGAKEEPKFKFQTNLPELFQESIFGKVDLMELLTDINEMNEEENLIEIDISMGSIKCSRLEIEA
ncbi:hypothetical protein BVC80_1663g26 [Macleaya cordata]|uniref:Transmembrane protein n=1 Tax=Macleaya cordata TaxID=56857 RepID=A0A200RBN5_MACCD|nr:hypothetical protein BVC80_1663g26 [Macleaya cordata]